MIYLWYTLTRMLQYLSFGIPSLRAFNSPFSSVRNNGLHEAYVADWKVQLEAGKPHEVKDHSVEVRYTTCSRFF
jgi:hypothetical protein